ncbi:MAG: hypothetical protein DAHOPDDO_00157 [Ignavibacteriaceae bacterium]|nr:hypothetical protein [Ignavibacteriaceae bacterium]
MSDYNSNFWDERFSVEGYVYGTEPNKFFKEQLMKINPVGRLLLPAEGEGRNAVFAAKLGWKVDAFDQSKVARQKAMKLSKVNDVKIDYFITQLEDFIPHKNYYDCAAIIFVHVPTESRSIFYKKIIESLKPKGKIIIELFSKNQLGKNSGGPQDTNMLASVEDIRNDFNEIKIELLTEENIYLEEGEKHSGEASVIRLVGKKI